jgi:hypothetical protein
MPLRIRPSVFGDPRSDLAAGGEPKFGQYVCDVSLGRSLGDDKSFRDGFVAKTLREQHSDFLLTRSQRGGAGKVHLPRFG